MLIKEGIILNHRYKIESLAGQGGMARVYKATDLESGHTVAIKALKDELSDDLEFVRRFDLEARAAASLSHPNIVRVYGVGEDKGLRYIVQEYIEGHSLKDEIRAVGRLDWRVAAPVAIQIALALEHAHSHGIIHRDIKPANILMTTDGVAMVTDFGIARAVNNNTVTMTGGNALGSVHYFSPEQARGAMVNHKTDLYSLGILMYEMVCGSTPFDGDSSVAVAVKQLQEQPVRPRDIEPSIPQGLEDIILRCMQKSPDSRYEQARQLIDDLDAFMINPNGRYGVLKKAAVQAAAPIRVPGENNPDTFAKVINLEKDIIARRRSRIRDTVLAAVVALVCIAALVVGLSYLAKQIGTNVILSSESANMFLIQDYSNRRYSDVEPILVKEGIKHRKIEAPSEQIAEGNIIAQSIAQGTRINRDSTYLSGGELILTVSIGSEFTLIPDLSGYTGAEAVNLLSSKGYDLLVSQHERFSLNVGAGMIIEMNPQPGAMVKKESRIDIFISKGKNTGAVPDVEKQQVDAAKAYLASIGFDANIIVPSYLKGSEKDLYVVKMEPKAGTKNITGAVNLYAGTYADAFPTPTPIPTTTVETTATEAPTEPTTVPTNPPPTTQTPAPTTPAPTTPAPTTPAPTTVAEG